jgi:hypothetical protein
MDQTVRELGALVCLCVDLHARVCCATVCCATPHMGQCSSALVELSVLFVCGRDLSVYPPVVWTFRAPSGRFSPISVPLPLSLPCPISLVTPPSLSPQRNSADEDGAEFPGWDGTGAWRSGCCCSPGSFKLFPLVSAGHLSLFRRSHISDSPPTPSSPPRPWPRRTATTVCA